MVLVLLALAIVAVLIVGLSVAFPGLLAAGLLLAIAAAICGMGGGAKNLT